MSTILFDAHAHLYPSYSLRDFFLQAHKNLSSLIAPLTPTDTLSLCLTERSQEGYYQKLKNGDISLGDSFSITQIEGALQISSSDWVSPLLIFPGKQTSTHERLEIHALFTEQDFEDNLSWDDSLSAVFKSDALVALPWAPGKWLGGRGTLVSASLEATSPSIVVSDTALRPNLFPQPSQFTFCRSHNIPIICGTDPLPLPGEEHRVGRYATRIEGNFEGQLSGPTLRSLIHSAQSLEAEGKRLSLFSVATKIIALKKQRTGAQLGE